MPTLGRGHRMKASCTPLLSAPAGKGVKQSKAHYVHFSRNPCSSKLILLSQVSPLPSKAETGKGPGVANKLLQGKENSYPGCPLQRTTKHFRKIVSMTYAGYFCKVWRTCLCKLPKIYLNMLLSSIQKLKAKHFKK